MKNYRLIKKLPFDRSPEIGYISKPNPPNDKFKQHLHYWNHNWFDPANHPEYWEEVVERGYEILSLFDRFLRREIRDTENVLINELKSNTAVCIHSIKRISDGGVFTVGDIIYTDDFKPTRLEKITIRDNGGVAMWGNYHSVILGEVGLASCIIKKPLFTTEDGVDIFEGDTFWFVNIIKPNGFIAEQIAKKGCPNSKKTEYILDFSTKEKAETYVLYNRPLFSVQEICEYFNIKFNLEVEHLIKKAKEKCKKSQ